MNLPAAIPAHPRHRSPGPGRLLAAAALATLLAQAAPGAFPLLAPGTPEGPAASDASPLLAPGTPEGPAASDASPLPTPGASATLLPPDDLASPDAPPSLEAQEQLEATVLLGGFFLLYDMNGKYGAEYTFNSSPQLADTVVRFYRGSTGALLGTAYDWRENYGAMLNATVGDGYYVEFSSSQSPTVAGYWAAGMPVTGTSNFPIWLVPVDGEAVGMKFGGGDWSHLFEPSFEFAGVSVRPFLAQQDCGASIGQTVGRFYPGNPAIQIRVDYLEGNDVHGRAADQITIPFDTSSVTLWWGDPDQGTYMGSFLPYGPIRITCTAEGMSSGSVEVDMVRDHFWAVRPVLSENPVVLDESTFALPSITPSPSLPFPTATEALNTGAMSQTVSRVDQWRILER